MKKILVIPLFCFFIFISLSAQELFKPTEQKADVYFIRNEFYGSFFSFNFFHNNEFVGKLRGLSYLKYECSPGSQLFWAVAGNEDFLELNVEAGETYIVKADFLMRLYKGKVKLSLVNKDDSEFNYLVNKIQRKHAVTITAEEIHKVNASQKIFILETLKNYHEKKRKNVLELQAVILPESLSTQKECLDKASNSPIILDYNFADFPFSKKSIELSGIGGLFTNPSMSQSLNISSSFYNATREGLYRVMTKNSSTKRYYRPTAMMVDFLAYFPIPLTSGWVHEEFHRSVLAKHGGNSYNEMNNFPITKSLIFVRDVKDEDLIALKKNNPADMVRMAEAGIEGEYMLANNMNKMAFFYNVQSKSFVPILATLNSSLYVFMSAGKSADNEMDKLYKAEGEDITKRDLLGFDFLTWTYDLFRPGEPYENRGTHPSGVGIDRYIKRSQLTHRELSYLKQQGYLQLINFINPLSLFHTSYTLKKNENGDNTRVNFYFNHWLAPFGFDISTTGLLHSNHHNYAFTFHNYANYYKWSPGLEIETYSYLIGAGKLKRPIPFSARAMIWVQPDNQLFFANKGAVGGFAETKFYYPVNKHIHPYISVSAKTNGWVQGNVYLEKNISGEFGLRAYF